MQQLDREFSCSTGYYISLVLFQFLVNYSVRACVSLNLFSRSPNKQLGIKQAIDLIPDRFLIPRC